MFAATVFSVHGSMVSEDERENLVKCTLFVVPGNNQGKKAPAGRRGQGFSRAIGL
jgi:hypothetical protein